MNRNTMMLVWGGVVIVLLILLVWTFTSKNSVQSQLHQERMASHAAHAQAHAAMQQLEESKAKAEAPTPTSKGTLVLFHSNGCGHCQDMMGDWKMLVDRLTSEGVSTQSHESSQVGRQMGQHEIKGFPTIRWYPNGFDVNASPQPHQEFQGQRSKENMYGFVQHMLKA